MNMVRCGKFVPEAFFSFSIYFNIPWPAGVGHVTARGVFCFVANCLPTAWLTPLKVW